MRGFSTGAIFDLIINFKSIKIILAGGRASRGRADTLSVLSLMALSSLSGAPLRKNAPQAWISEKNQRFPDFFLKCAPESVCRNSLMHSSQPVYFTEQILELFPLQRTETVRIFGNYLG